MDNNIYNDLVKTYYTMKDQKIRLCNEVKDMRVRIEQLEIDITRIECILSDYGTHVYEHFKEVEKNEQTAS